MSVICGSEPCPLLLSSSCVFYEGENLLYIGVNTNDSFQTALQQINQAFQNAQMGYIFNNGLIQSALSQPVQLGGSLIQNTTIGGNFTLTFAGNVQAAKHITTGGTSSQFVKGDGTLDSSSFQPPGNYITALSGDGVATGPGAVPFTLNTVNSNPGTFGAGSSIPVVTVNAKGLVTSLTTTPLVTPPQSITFIGDVFGTGFTQSTITLVLQNVNPNPYVGITPLKFAVNAKGLVTAASPITSGDIISILGYTPGTVSSVGISVPPAFAVSNSPITTSGTIGISAIGTALQYIKGDGSLGTAPISTSGTAGTSGTSGTTGTSGTSATSGTSGTSGTSATSGTSGTSGSSGTSGTSGSTGTSGTSGTTGTSGSSGTTGTSGSSGTSGTTGTSGTSGTSGTTGLDGSNGTSGTSGTTGSSGTSGTSGTTGTSGTSGTSGSTGTSGSSGLSGDRFATTSSSTYTLQAPGNSGTITVGLGLNYTVAQSIIIAFDANNHNEAEVVSYDPLTGILNFTVFRLTGSGTYSTWQVNLDGATGGDGSSGTSGTSGTSATSGTSGTTGSSGSSGTSGTTGTSGSSGTSGTSATDGTGGTSGTSGTTGTSGSSGTSGTTGTSGSSGTSGTSATDGTGGTSGTSGSSATSGTTGTSGTSGTSGTAGTSGSSGTTGTSGTSGTSGTTGTSGTSGTSGLLGSATSPLFISSNNITIQQASGSQSGFLSSTDWTTFNNKQNALTNPVTGTGTTNYLPKFTGSTTIGNSQIFDNGTNVGIGTTSPASALTVVGAADYNTILLRRNDTANSAQRVAVLARNFANNQTFGLIGAADVAGSAIDVLIGLDGTIGPNRIVFRTASTYGATTTQKMLLDSSGNLGLGVTPSAWNAVFKVLESGDSNNQTAIAFQNNANVIYLTTNSFFDTSWKYKFSDNAGQYLIDGADHRWYNAPSGTAGNAISFTQAMTLTSGGNVLVGTTTDNGARLQVSGTATISLNQNALTNLRIFNTTVGGNSYVGTTFSSDSSAGIGEFGKYSSGTATYKITTASSTYIYNGTAGNISIQNDFSGGSIVMAAGGSSTAHFTIASTGAATFSSKLTTGGITGIAVSPSPNTLSNGSIDLLNGAGMFGYLNKNYITANMYYSSGWTYKATAAASLLNLTDGGMILYGAASGTAGTAITLAPLLTIDSTGAATFSSSVTANRYLINGSNGNSGQIIQQGDLLGTAATNLLLQSSSGNSIGFLTNGSNDFRMFINTSGNVGIGTASPAHKLVVEGTVPRILAKDSLGAIAQMLGINNSEVAFGSQTNHPVRILVNDADVARFTTDGYLRMAASTGGIQFNGDTAAANALDDYEEGTWTPTVTAESGSYTMIFSPRGTYTKIGRVVTLTYYFEVNNKGTGSGACILSSLPFASKSSSSGDTYVGSGIQNSSNNPNQIVLAQNSSSLYIYENTGDPITAALPNTGTITYIT